MKTPQSPHDNASTSCCGHSHSSQPIEPTQITSSPKDGSAAAYRIATMDCSTEESEIRRVLEPITGVRSLGFQLGARTLVIDAPAEVLPLALAAIRKIGFDPKEISRPSDRANASGAHDDHDQGFSSGITRLVFALVFAFGAESLSFLAPDTQPWQIAGMAIAVIGIWLADSIRT